MSIEETILSVGKSKKVFRTSDVMNVLEKPYRREYISTIITRMVNAGSIIRDGSGRWSTYALPENQDYLGHRINKRLALEGLVEHEVLDDVMRMSNVLRRMPENLQSIFNYAFSEMLNNAIDHSRSEHAGVTVTDDGNQSLKFVVRDYGIGVFVNIMKERGLHSEVEAMQDLLKGKTTTVPLAHSGEGIFFTSKIADLFVLESFGYRLRIDNRVPDVFFEKVDSELTGTKVSFEISLSSKKHLIDLFTSFRSDPDDPAFDKTEIQIKLYTMGTIYVSRSQARRLLTGLEKFKTINLDFTSVPAIGQAFADEIFRVFQAGHPDIVLNAQNMNEAVAFMVARAKAT